MAVFYVLLLSLIAVAQAQLFPVGQEVVYSYHGHVQNMVEKPTLHTSEYFINANIHIKGFNNGSRISLHDITYNTYLGKGKLTDESVVQPIPPESECLQLPFFVQYNLDGKILNVLTDKNDQHWSVNMKQAISSLFQLDFLQMDLTKTKPYAFSSDEQTVYGHCHVHYDVIPHNKTSSTVKKWIKKCKDYRWEMNFNVLTPGHCEENFDHSLQLSSYRTYDIEWSNKVLLINRLESDGSNMFYPISGSGGAHSVHVKQILTKLNVTPMSDVSHDENLIPRGVKVQLHKPNAILGSAPDMTLGRSTVDLEVVMPKMRESLHRVVEFLKQSHVTLKEPDWTQGQSIHELLIYLRVFDVHSFEHCYKILCNIQNSDDQGMLDVYLQIVPYVGTHASNVFIRNLVKSKKVENDVVLKMLQEMPFHTRFPNEVLLKELAEFTQWGTDVNEEIRSAAVLSFSTLLSRVLKNHPESVGLNVYVDHLIEKFRSSKDYYSQMLYLSALQNLESMKVTKFLEPLIMNRKTSGFKVTPQLRNLAIWAAKHTHIQHPEVANGIYWPILLDKNEPLEIRTSALNVLMTNSSMNSQIKIYWHMMTETDEDLYNVYYTTLQTLSASSSRCYVVSSLTSKRILNYIRHPANSSAESSVYQYDYYDSGFNMGATLKASHIGNLVTHMSTAFYVQFSSHISNLMVNHYSNYLKLSISKNLRDVLESSLKTSKSMNDVYVSIAESNSVLGSPDDFHMEYISMLRNRVVSVKYYNSPSTLKKLWYGMIENPSGSQTEAKYNIGQVVEGRVIIPTDIGLPSSVYVSMPTVQKSKMSYEPEMPLNSPIISLKYKMDAIQWNYMVYGMDVYDPITNVWHGSRRFLTVDHYLPLSVDVSCNIQQKTSKMSFNTLNNKDAVSGNIGFQAFVQSQVYKYDVNKMEFVNYEKVSNGVEHRKEYVVFDKDLEDVGLRLKVVIFDCERSIAPSRLIHLQRQFLSNYNKNWGNLPILKMLLAVRHWWAYVTLSANPGMCGMGVQASPSLKYPATHADLSMRLGTDDESSVNQINDGSKWNFRSTYNLKNEDEVVKSWDLNVIAESFGERLSDLDIVLTRTKPGLDDYKVCINGNQLWKDESVTSQWTMLAGETVNSKCPHNNSKIEISVKSELSEEQLDTLTKKTVSHPSCHPDKYAPLVCTMSQTSLRHTEIDSHFVNLPKPLTHIWTNVIDWLRTQYGYHFVREFDEDKLTPKGNIKIVLDYPEASDDVNVVIHSPHEVQMYEGIPLSNWYWSGLVQPYSTHVSLSSLVKYHLGLSYSCEIRPEYLVNQYKTRKEYRVPQDWTLYASDSGEKPKWKVYVKKVDETHSMAVRIVVSNDPFDIYSHHGEFQFHLNDKQLPALQYGYRSSSWFDYRVIRQEHKVSVHVQSVGINVDYDGSKIRIQLPKAMTSFKGLCYEM